MKTLAVFVVAAVLGAWAWSTFGILWAVWRRATRIAAPAHGDAFGVKELLWVVPLAIVGGAALVVNAMALLVGWAWYRARGKALPPAPR